MRWRPAAGLPDNGPVDRTRPQADSAVRVVLLVEGHSDQIAVETLAGRLGRDLDAEGWRVVVMGGAMSVGRFAAQLAPSGLDVRGLCDVREEPFFRRALGSYAVCDADLEDELIRALGPAATERVLAAQGDLRRFRTFQNQPAQRGRPEDRQLRRFIASIGGRKARYARALVAELDLARVPPPLTQVLAEPV